MQWPKKFSNFSPWYKSETPTSCCFSSFPSFDNNSKATDLLTSHQVSSPLDFFIRNLSAALNNIPGPLYCPTRVILDRISLQNIINSFLSSWSRCVFLLENRSSSRPEMLVYIVRSNTFWDTSMQFITAAWLAQLGERRSAEREVVDSNPGWTNT